MLEKPAVNKNFIREFIPLFLMLVVAVIAPAFQATASESTVVFERANVIIQKQDGTQAFDTEIAESKEQLKQGLMNRKSLAANQAMLFLFDGKQKIAMWMKNTLIPLDMLFIDNSGKIIYIAHAVKPNSTDMISAGNTPVRAVLELKGGSAKELNIAVGDKVVYKVFE